MKSNPAERTQFIILVFILAVFGFSLASTSCQLTSLEEPPEATIESMYLYPPSQQANPGQELAVTVEVRSMGTIITGGEIRLTFNPAVLNVTEVAAGDLLGVDAVFGLSDIDNEIGEIRFALARKGEGPDSTSSSVLSVIKLKVLDTASPGSYQLNLHEVLLTDDEFNFIPDVICQGAYIDIMDKQTTTYALIVEAIPSDGGYVDPKSDMYISGERLEFKAVAAERWKFVRWGRDLSGSNDMTELVMDDNKWVVAHFSPVETLAQVYSLTIMEEPSEGGHVRHSAGGGEGEFRFESDEAVQLTAVPDEGYEFDYWSGDVSGRDSSVRLVMDGNKKVVAHFKR